MNKWLELAASEEMNSQDAITLIAYPIGLIQDMVGLEGRKLGVGCADGTELDLLGEEAEGIDLNDASIAKSIEKGYKVSKMDMHEMTFADNTFNLVFARDVFEHAVSPIQAISEMARVSKKYVCVVVPDPSWLYSGWHYMIPTLKQMLALGEKVGLNLRSYREYNYLQGKTIVWQDFYLFEKR